jgi:hypothetical protein
MLKTGHPANQITYLYGLIISTENLEFILNLPKNRFYGITKPSSPSTCILIRQHGGVKICLWTTCPATMCYMARGD